MNDAYASDAWKNERENNARKGQRKSCGGEIVEEGMMGRSTRLNSTCVNERKEGAATTNAIAFNPETKLDLHRLDRRKIPNTKTVMYVPA